MAATGRAVGADRMLPDDGVVAGGGGTSPKSVASGMEKGAVMSIIINLEKEKLRLGGQISRDKRSVEELGKVVEALQANVLAQRAKLGAYNALFMRMSDADVKAPRQRLGAREAVLGTKRIINRELERLENEVVVAEMKLNRSRERNQGIREKINQLRREHVTFRHLFEKMRGELGELKQGIALVDRAVDGEYGQRDRAYGEMRELAKQFEVDKLERLQTFRQVTEELEAIPLGVAPQESVFSKTPKSHTSSAMDPAAGGGAGGGGEDALRKRVAKAQQKLTKDRYAIEQAHRKLATFSTALRRIKASTGYARTAEVSAIFNRYEEEKFAKAQLAQRLMDEIEALEGSVAAMHSELTAREGENAALKAQRSAAVEALTRTAREHEAELAETSGAVQTAVGDVRSLYRVIEFAFYALGIRSAMDEVAGKTFVAPGSPHGGSEAGGFSVPSSPLRAGYAGGEGFDGAASSSSHLGSSRGPSPLRTGSVSPAAFGGGGGGGLRMLSLSRGALMASPDGGSGGGLTSVGSAAGGGSGGSGGHSMVRRQRSMSMYAGDARMRHAVRSGVSASSLGAFMGTIENKSAEVIQQYAAVMTKIASGDLSLAHMRFAAGAGGGGGLAEGSDENRDDGEDGGEDGEGGRDPEFAAAAAAMQARRQMQSFAAGSGEAARRLLQNPSVLGPSNPPGRVKESIAASALMASLAVDSARMAGEMDGPGGGAGGGGHGSGASQAGFSHALGSGPGYGGGGGGAGGLGVEDDSRLLSVAELKAQAMRRLATDRSIQALKSAAAAAANVLVGNGGGMPGGLGGSGSGAAGGGKGRAGSNGGR